MSTDADRRIRKRILFGAGKQHLISKIIAVAAGEKLGMRGKGWKGGPSAEAACSVPGIRTHGTYPFMTPPGHISESRPEAIPWRSEWYVVENLLENDRNI